MANLIILRGLPASGKSTCAKSWVSWDPERRLRVNRDDLRRMLHDGTFIKGSKDNPGTEQTVIKAQLAIVEKSLKAGLDVIDDNTNLPNRSVKQLVEVAEKVGASWEIKDFTDVPLGVCLERNEQRESHVPEDAIRNMHQKFIAGKKHPLPFEYKPKAPFALVPYVPQPMKPKAFICDIDGTVALMNNRGPYEYDKVGSDLPNWPVIGLVRDRVDLGYEPLFLSGRKAMCYDATWDWLNFWVMDMNHANLWTRAADDNRADWLIKYELFDNHVRNQYNVKYVYDDRNQVVEMWRKLGLTCLQVADGNF